MAAKPRRKEQRVLARSKALRAGHGDAALTGNRRQRSRANDERARDVDETFPALRGTKPLEARTLDVAVG